MNQRDTGSDRAERALSAAIDRRGSALLLEPGKLKALLFEAAPDAPRVIDAIVAAVAAQVPQSMMAAHSDDHLAAILPTLVDRLSSAATLDHRQATWIVQVWAKALALPTRGLDTDAAPVVAAVAPSTMSDQRASLAAVLGSKSRPAPVMVERPPQAVEPVRRTSEVERVEAMPTQGRLVAEVDRDTSPPELVTRAVIHDVVASPSIDEVPSPPPVDLDPVPIDIAPAQPIVVPQPDVVATPAASIPTRPSMQPTAQPSPHDAMVAAPAKPGSRRPVMVMIACAAIVVIGFGVWRWMSMRQPIVAPATAQPELASAPATAAPSTSPSTGPSAPPTPVASTPPPDEAAPIAAVAASPAATPVLPAVDDQRVASPASPASASTPPAMPPSRPTAPPASPARSAATAAGPRAATSGASTVAPAPVASPSREEAPTACSRDSCGSVVSVRAARDDAPAAEGRGYEMTIRMDDRSIRTMTRSSPLRTGSRVRMVGNAFVPTAD